jgi:hypothetical protein
MCDADGDNSEAFRAVVHPREKLWKIMSVALPALCRHALVRTICRVGAMPKIQTGPPRRKTRLSGSRRNAPVRPTLAAAGLRPERVLLQTGRGKTERYTTAEACQPFHAIDRNSCNQRNPAAYCVAHRMENWTGVRSATQEDGSPSVCLRPSLFDLPRTR